MMRVVRIQTGEPVAEYELYYWPMLQGRGEFVRLVLEDAGVAYRDVARAPKQDGGGVEPVMRFYRGEVEGHPAYAPPIVKLGDLVLAQMPNLCMWLGDRHGLAPTGEGVMYHANQVQLTIADVVSEVHETHHPLGSMLRYEDQVEPAKTRARLFCEQRLGKWLAYFERVLRHNGGQVLVGDDVSYVDLSMFQLLSGLEYAYPNAFDRVRESIPGLLALRAGVAIRPRMAGYLASDRRVPFNEHGIFRCYPELDLPSA